MDPAGVLVFCRALICSAIITPLHPISVDPDVTRRRKQRVRVPRLPIDRMQPPPDCHGIHEATCRDLADELGYEFRGLWYWWCEIAKAVEWNTGYPRAVCEQYAVECVRFSFDKRGCVGD